MLQHWSCLIYRYPDLLLLLGHKCEIRIYQWARARVAHPAGRVPLFPFSVFFHGHFKLKRQTLFGWTQPRSVLRMKTPPGMRRRPPGLRPGKTSHALTWCLFPECPGSGENRRRHPALRSSSHGIQPKMTRTNASNSSATLLFRTCPGRPSIAANTACRRAWSFWTCTTTGNRCGY